VKSIFNFNYLGLFTDEDGESQIIQTGRKGIKLAIFEPGKDVVFRLLSKSFLKLVILSCSDSYSDSILLSQ
jgi:hypothetical protein